MLFLVLNGLPAAANDLHLAHGARLHAPSPPIQPPTGTYAQAVDHAGALPGQTFAQRYWINSTYASGPNAPVLFHICGESSVDGAYFLTDAVLGWAKTLGAHVVFLEHRYYGESQPFSDLSTAHLQYLTLPNVLEDLASFQKWIAAKQGWTGQWIALGGSYSGTLAALYRQRHPDLVVGALASSAPMIAGVGQAIGSDEDVYDASSTTTDNEERTWLYQGCNNVGFWEAEGPDANDPLDLPSAWLCQQLFGQTPMVNASLYNQSYDKPFLQNSPNAPSNILFTYGGDDVWTQIGLASARGIGQPKSCIFCIK